MTDRPATVTPAAAAKSLGHSDAHPDLFTADEAASYLRLPSTRALFERCREHKVKGCRNGRVWMFAREQLDYLRLAMFGLEEKRPESRMRKIG